MATETPARPFLECSLREFLDTLASPSPTPGGGSAAALGGAIAAALVSMVASLTVASPKCEDAHEAARELLRRSEAVRASLQDLIQEDSQAFAGFAAAQKLPKAEEAQRVAREKAMQAALLVATETPLRICREAVAACELSLTAAEIGNAAAVSDAGVGAVLAEAAVKGASLNVDINVGYLKDQDFAARAQAEAQELVLRAAAVRQRAVAVTASRL